MIPGVAALSDLAHVSADPSSPLIESSQMSPLVPHDSSFLSNSLGAFVVAAECLINACAAARPEQARQALQMRDRMIGLLEIEVPAVGTI